MPRPRKRRRISQVPDVFYFKPQGIPMRNIEELSLSLDEVEAMRLADFEGLSQEETAEKMGVSRQTVGRILIHVHKKLAEAILHGKAIRIEHEDIENDAWILSCPRCRRNYIIPEKPVRKICGKCSSDDVELHRGLGRFGRNRGGRNRG